MQKVLCIFTLLLASVAAKSLDTNEEFKNRPVAKVVNMLKDMKTQLEAEADADEEMVEKMQCWCDTGEKEKTKAIADAEQRITDTTALVEENTATSARLATEISTITDEVAANTAALEKASGIRTKENADFEADAANMNEGINGLHGAVSALSSHHSFLSVSQELRKHISPANYKKVLSSRQDRRLVASFLQQPVAAQSYAPQSGQIFGILKQMKEGFETNLADATNEENTAASAFAQMKAAKESEIAAGNEQIRTKTGEQAAADTTVADGQEDLASTRESLAADQEFLSNLKQKCDSFNREFAQRQQTRTEEMAAVGEVISMLTDDDARDLFSRTYSFVQVSKSQSFAKVTKAMIAAAKKANDPRLSALAVSVKLDNFGTVKEKVQNMIDDLNAEKGEDEVTHAKCLADLKDNSDDAEAKNTEKARLETHIADLTQAIANLTDEIANANNEISATMVDMKRASEDREKENKEFQQTVADQRATVVILNKVLKRLQDVYAPGAKTEKAKALLQRKAMVLFGAPEEPAGFGGDYKKQSSGGVLGLIEMTIADAERLEKETLAAEQTQQTEYEALVKDASAQIAADSESITAKKGEKATAEVSKTEAEASYEGVTTELANLASYADSLHASCDFVLKNFDLRQKSRSDEMAALEDAKAILSGADFK